MVAVDTIETTLGQVLLLLIGLAVVLLLLILLLVEANYIVRLSRKLVRRLRPADPEQVASEPIAPDDGQSEAAHDEQDQEQEVS